MMDEKMLDEHCKMIEVQKKKDNNFNKDTTSAMKDDRTSETNYPNFKKDYDNFDSLVEELGFGKWTIFMFGNFLCWAILLPCFSLGGAFYNPTVNHWCKIPQLDNTSWTMEQRINYSIPWEMRGGQLQRSKCRMYVRDYDVVSGNWSTAFLTSHEQASVLSTIPCDSWYYDTSTFNSTVTMEWDLVCGNAGLSPFYQSFYFFGCTFGEPLLGILADRFGRRRVISVSAIIFGVTSVSSALVPYYSLVLAGRFIMGLIHTIIGPAYVQGMEVSPARFRAILGLVSIAPFAITGMMFGAYAYLVRDWRTLQLICTVPVTLLILQIPIMVESPRWLMLKGRYEEAAKALRRAARWHTVNLPSTQKLVIILQKLRLESPELKTSNDDEGQTKEEGHDCCGRIYKWLNASMVLVRTPALRRITLSLFICWYCSGLTFWGMSLSSANFSTDPFLYIVFGALMELSGYTIIVPAIMRFGGKTTLILCFAVSSLAILLTLVTPKSYTWLIFCLAMAGKFFITACYGLLYMVTSELFPTCVRSRGFNLSSMMGRIGSIVSPFINDILAARHWWAPSVLFGAFAGVGCIFAFLLPDSTNKPIADTVDELELIYGSSLSKNIQEGYEIPLNQDPDCRRKTSVQRDDVA